MATESVAAWTALLGSVRAAAERAGVFGACRVQGDRLVCEAKASAEPAEYRLEQVGGRCWVSLVMKDRWQSESIESDLMHTGDKLEELIEEELAELGYEGPHGADGSVGLRFEHFRSDEMLFTFRTPVPTGASGFGGEEAARAATMFLLAYEACFRNLGDMSAQDVEE